MFPKLTVQFDRLQCPFDEGTLSGGPCFQWRQNLDAVVRPKTTARSRGLPCRYGAKTSEEVPRSLNVRCII